jgi:hypothetical protein
VARDKSLRRVRPDPRAGGQDARVRRPAAAAEPRVGGDYFGVWREGRGFDYATAHGRVYVTGKVEKPRHVGRRWRVRLDRAARVRRGRQGRRRARLAESSAGASEEDGWTEDLLLLLRDVRKSASSEEARGDVVAGRGRQDAAGEASPTRPRPRGARRRRRLRRRRSSRSERLRRLVGCGASPAPSSRGCASAPPVRAADAPTAEERLIAQAPAIVSAGGVFERIAMAGQQQTIGSVRQPGRRGILSGLIVVLDPDAVRSGRGSVTGLSVSIRTKGLKLIGADAQAGRRPGRARRRAPLGSCRSSIPRGPCLPSTSPGRIARRRRAPARPEATLARLRTTRPSCSAAT